mgnify:CR=1 FL=1
MYTHRIMDITNQIVKQNKDIDKITADIRWASHTALSPPPFFNYFTSAKPHDAAVFVFVCLVSYHMHYWLCVLFIIYCRDIQKTINLNASTLQRADAIAEELIFAVSPIVGLLLSFHYHSFLQILF